MDTGRGSLTAYLNGRETATRPVVPLDLIDTQGGPETVPATSGSELRVNFGVNDADGPQHVQTAYGIFWAEDPRLPPRNGGEDF